MERPNAWLAAAKPRSGVANMAESLQGPQKVSWKNTASTPKVKPPKAKPVEKAGKPKGSFKEAVPKGRK